MYLNEKKKREKGKKNCKTNLKTQKHKCQKVFFLVSKVLLTLIELSTRYFEHCLNISTFFKMNIYQKREKLKKYILNIYFCI